MTVIVEWPRAWWQPRSGQFFLAPRSQASSSPWTMRQNVYGPHVQYWCAKLAFPLLSDAEAAEREALLESVGGQAGLIRMGFWQRRTPLYNGDVTVTEENFSDGTEFSDGTGFASGYLPPQIAVIEAAARGATGVLVGGLPASTAAVLRRGDLVEFQRNGVWDETPSLHRVKHNAPTDASGETRIEIVPPLRAGLAPGDAVMLEYPATVFRMVDDEQGAFDRDVNAHGSHGLSLVEALL